MTLQHQLIALMVTFIWGTNFVFIKYGIGEMPPFLFAALRFTIAAIPLVFFFPKPNASWLLIGSYGLFIGMGQFGSLFWAMQADIAPGIASLIIQSQVFFTVLLAALLFAEKINFFQIIALLISFSGLGVIFLYTDGDVTPLGLGLTLFGALSWACGNLISKKAGSVDIIGFLAWSSLFAAPPLWCLAFYLHGFDSISYSLTHATWVGWTSLLWQSIGNTLIGYGLWNVLLREYSSAVAAPWSLLVPVFGMTASSFMLDEAMPAWKLIAASLIMLGLIINMLAAQRKAQPLK